MSGPDGHEQRMAWAEECEREDDAREELALQLADESRDNPPLSEAEYAISPTTASVMQSAVRLQLQRDALADTLRDIACGADMLIQSGMWSGASLHYIQEVHRVARTGLREAQV